MFNESWEEDMQDLESAEDFFDFFGVVFDAHVVRISRLHILQRFHDNVATQKSIPENSQAKFTLYGALLASAHKDFVDSTPAQEKALRVYQTLPDEPAFVPLSAMFTQSDA